MPYTIFSHVSDSEGSLSLLREAGFEVEATANGWKATGTFKEGLLRKRKSLVITFDRDWCTPPNWTEQLDGMQGYFSRFPIPDEMRGKVMGLIGSFRFSLGTISEPEIEDGSDPRLEVLHALAAQVDGVLFTPGALLDPNFQLLIDAEGTSDPEAQFPEFPTDPVTTSAEMSEHEGLQDEDEERDPPGSERVARRALALTAVAARGLMDMNLAQGLSPAYSHEHLRAWVEGAEIDGELEPEEKRVIETAPRALDHQDALNAVWRLEGLVVLAWALGLCELPAYDAVVDTDQLLATLGFPNEPDRARALLETPVLKSPNALKAYQEQAFALHWRLVDFRVNPQAMDFAKMKEECWFGPLDLSWATLAENDLAIQGEAISRANADAVGTVASIANERHRAANWLIGYASVYSETDVNT